MSDPGSTVVIVAFALLASACAAPLASHAPDTGIRIPACEQPAVPDTDADGLSDGCELDLARAFAPELVADADDCLWDAGARRLDGGYLIAVAPRGRDGARIAYLPAYARDCGWPGGGGAHDGDSELVLVDATAQAGAWRAEGAFLSSHCFGRSDGRCRWFRGAVPAVWVASAKHAHYPSRAACESGHWRRERCATPARERRYRFPVWDARQNVGSRARPAHGPRGCVSAAALPVVIRGADPSVRECVWDDRAPFRGWRATRTGAPPTPYGLLLRRIAGW